MILDISKLEALNTYETSLPKAVNDFSGLLESLGTSKNRLIYAAMGLVIGKITTWFGDDITTKEDFISYYELPLQKLREVVIIDPNQILNYAFGYVLSQAPSTYLNHPSEENGIVAALHVLGLCSYLSKEDVDCIFGSKDDTILFINIYNSFITVFKLLMQQNAVNIGTVSA